MSLPHTFDAEELLAQAGWVRSLALRIVRDPDVADDVAQDALLIAMSGAHERPQSLRSWLAAVVRNVGRGRYRSEERRARREAVAVEHEPDCGTTALFERATAQRAVVDELLALEEPYRSTLLLRFFEGCTPRETAARTGAPESTVATRTAEGLRRLRTRLSRDGADDPKGWLPALLPLLRRPEGTALRTQTLGVLAMSLSTKLILLGAVAAGIVLSYHALDVPRGGPEEPTALARKEAPQVQPVAPPSPRREVAPVAVSPPESVPSANAGLPPGHPPIHGPAFEDRLVRGRVIDLTGAPVAGLEVCRGPFEFVQGYTEMPALDEDSCIESGPDGAFEMKALPPFSLVVNSDTYSTVFAGTVHPGEGDTESLVVVSWRIPLSGVVVDDAGGGVAGALVTMHPHGRLLELPGNLLESSRATSLRAVTDEGGRFAFDNAPDVREARLHISAAGFSPATEAIPEGGTEGVVVVLSRPGLGSALEGYVVLADGSPAPDALVSIGSGAVATNDEGYFVFDLERLPEWGLPGKEEPIVLRAASRGRLPAQRLLPSRDEAEQLGWPRDIVLELGGTPLVIRGRVVDEEGNGVMAVQVAALDATKFGLVESRPGWWMDRTLEQMAGGGPTLTDRNGDFELGGLLDREYRLEVIQRMSLLRVATDAIAAGSTGVEIVLDRSTLGRIAGRIVDRRGAGVADVSVAVSRRETSSLAIGASATSDADGYFSLEGVTTEPSFLRLEGDAIVPDIFRELPDDTDVEELELVVGRRCYLQIDWGEGWPGRADQLHVADENGERLELVNLESGSITPGTSLDVGEGLSPVVVVSDAGAEAVITLRGEEVARLPLNLAPGELELLRP